MLWRASRGSGTSQEFHPASALWVMWLQGAAPTVVLAEPVAKEGRDAGCRAALRLPDPGGPDQGRAVAVPGWPPERPGPAAQEEVDPGARAPILRRYLPLAPGPRAFIPVDPDAALEEFQKVAPRIPVVRVIPSSRLDATAGPGPDRR